MTSGTANTTSGSKSLEGVSLAHPVRPGQVVEGVGIPSGSGTGSLVAGEKKVVLTASSGQFAVGQRVTAPGLGANVTVQSILSPTELELSEAPANSSTAAVTLVARATVVSVAGTSVEISAAAEATATGAAITGKSWPIEGASTAPIGQPGAGSNGSIYWPNRANKLERIEAFGELLGGGFPVTTNRPAAVALDKKGDIFVTTSSGTTLSCANTTAGRLKKLQPDGSNLPEGGPIGAESVFGGLTSNATAVAINKQTGNVYVGRNCGEAFSIEEYGPGGGLLTQFGAGTFGANSVGALVNQIAVDETSGTVYATDPGNQVAWAFADQSPKKTFAATVSGPGSVTCNETGQACLPEYDEGQEVIVEATGGTGFVEWTGGTGSAEACNGTTATSCTFTLSADSSIQAKYATGPQFPLTINFGGTGSGTAECDTGSGFGVCAPEYTEGTSVTIKDIPSASSNFAEWLGCESTTGSECQVTMTAAKTVEAINNESTTSPLTVAITGHGTVTSAPTGINCTESGGTCTEGFEGPVNLTGTPDSGWVLAGWIGCKHTGAGTCEIDVNEPKEVTAVFLESGANGKGVVIGNATAAECPQGGITVEVEGSGVKQAICNGATGAPGTPGSPGTPGAPGAQGPAGEAGGPGHEGPTGETGPTGAKGVPGARGAEGPAGPQGPAGKQGARGPKGKQGPAGKVKVTCKVNGSKKVTCTVKSPKGSTQARRLKWTLHRAGHVVSHGKTSAARLQRALNHLPPGHYRLHVAGQRAVKITVG